MTALTPRPHLLARRGPKRWPPRIILPGCRCCVVPPTYYIPPKIVTPCCTGGVPQNLTATVTATLSSNCQTAGLVGKTVNLTYRGVHASGNPYWGGWSGVASDPGFVLWCQDFGLSGLRICARSECGVIPTPTGGLGQIYAEMGSGGATCSPFYIPPTQIDFANSAACCPGNGSGAVRVTWTVTE